MPRTLNRFTELDKKINLALIKMGPTRRFSHKTKILHVYANSGLTPLLLNFVRKVEIVPEIPRKDVLAFAFLIQNQIRNTGISGVIKKYFQKAEPLHSIYDINELKSEHIINAYGKVRKKTLEKWSMAIKLIDTQFNKDPYIPKDVVKKPKTMRVLKINSSSPNKWREKLRR